MKFLALIPSRYASTRFPGKPLALLGGKPIVQWVYERVSSVIGDVYVATDDERIRKAVEDFGGRAVMVSPADMERISMLKTSNDSLATVRIPVFKAPRTADASRLALALDGVRNPGNMGTIIRLADWFGIEDVYCYIYSAPLTAGGVIVMGNEGKGISPACAAHLTHRLLIPPYPASRHGSESLNVAMAAAVVCAEFRRRAADGRM